MKVDLLRICFGGFHIALGQVLRRVPLYFLQAEGAAPGLDVDLPLPFSEIVPGKSAGVADDEFGGADLLQVVHREIPHHPEPLGKVLGQRHVPVEHPYQIIFSGMLPQQIPGDVFGTAAKGFEIVCPEEDLVALDRLAAAVAEIELVAQGFYFFQQALSN